MAGRALRRPLASVRRRRTWVHIANSSSKEFGPSSSGKTIIIASTEGSVSAPDREEKIGLNVYRKK